ncbi:hypothetical protein HanXRQr2_Chr04g0143011 [Helianthus annuus]|uniref:Uncharacterized protein n=1 Tax=Helianthus annuus TaxID=4232 RepID=A0A9K3J3M4_HELAN|nr:hypothetical protein HanXRQr2_Chr04g0143011 [Helianthus annuus]
MRYNILIAFFMMRISQDIYIPCIGKELPCLNEPLRSRILRDGRKLMHDIILLLK